MIPGKPANPRFLLIDTSVLLPLVVTEQMPLLRLLRTQYRVQPAIVLAVEAEATTILATHPKFRGRQDRLRKATSTGTITKLDRDALAASPSPDAMLRQIESEGRRLSLRVDRGEAYTHGAASVLGVPVATNDVTAVNRLLRDGEVVTRPVIRFWDLLVFGLQVGHLEEAACDRVRQHLVSMQERLPPCFTARSFVSGLGEFYARLADSRCSPIGAGTPRENLDQRLYLTAAGGGATSSS